MFQVQARNRSGSLKKLSALLAVSTTLFSQVATLPSEAAHINRAAAPKTNSKNKAVKNKMLYGRVEGSGQLVAMMSPGKKLGQCPLKHTSVEANISGYISRVRVKQTFANPFKSKIEAVYTFPLSQSAAIDSMTMKVGDRVIEGSIKKKEEARKIYNRARARGHVASLLDQERPNIFTQSVANIEPGKEIEITIDYIDLLAYEDGSYSFNFPTVVGPRFIPGSPTTRKGTGRSPDTDRVPDASKITPRVAEKGTRAGHDISIAVNLDASVPINTISSKLHQVSVKRKGKTQAQISLVNKKTIPNRDFVLSWKVADKQIKSGYLTYRDPKKDKSGYFTLMLLPPEKVTVKEVAPKEMVFLIDCSGSQSGRPLAKAKETLNYIVDNMNPQDTFQIISFNNRSEALFEKPRPSNAAMRQKAKSYIQRLEARGGTWMAPAVERVCNIKAPQNRLRIVTFMTDGYVGNDMEILGMVKKLRGKSRWFPFGTGNSVNRYLIDGIAKEGGGEAEYVLLNAKAGEVGKKFYNRISTPVLTDIKVQFSGVEVKEVFPKNLTDLWARKPLYIKGRYLKPGAGSVTLSGFRAGKPYKQTMAINFPESDTKNSGIASVWARAKVDRLLSEDWRGAQYGKLNKELKDEIVRVALKHHIMTQFTSFVAVEKRSVTKGGKPLLVTVPVEMPDGVSREGVFGITKNKRSRVRRSGIAGGTADGMVPSFNMPSASPPPPPVRSSSLRKRGFARQQSYSLHSLPKSGMGQRMNRRYYKSPRKLQVISAAPKAQIKDYRNSADKEESKKLDLNKQKLAINLRGLTSSNITSIPNLVIEQGKVKVSVKLNRLGSRERKLLEQAGLSKITLKQRGKYQVEVTGFITPEMLTKLAALKFVRTVRPAA